MWSLSEYVIKLCGMILQNITPVNKNYLMNMFVLIPSLILFTTSRGSK